MSDFKTSRETGRSLDPSKRTNHVLGLVMGEDEFQTDMHHLRERDHRAVRALHGYGTVAGLGVVGDNGQDELEVRPGLAVDPVGRLICVPDAQCATIDDWLNVSANRQEVEDAFGPFGAAPTPVLLYVVLCYDECYTDDVPVPAAECLSAEESTVASRIAESFELRLTLERPESVGEISDPTGSLPESLPGSSLTLVDLVEQIWQTVASFPDSLPPGSLPEFDEVKQQILDWVVRERPELAQGLPCLDVQGDPCVLLASVAIDVRLELRPEGDALAMVGQPTVDDDDRPILLSTRFLQELLIRFAAASEEWRELALDDLVDVDAALPADSEVLTFQAGRWLPAPPAVGGGAPTGPAGGDLDGTYPDPGVRALRGRPMTGPVANGQALLFTGPPASGRWLSGPVIKPGDTAGGDLDGTYPDPQVDGILGFPVELSSPPVPPNDGDTLTFGGGVWRVAPPAAPPAAPTTLDMALPFATITQLDDFDSPNAYVIWFHIDSHGNDSEVLPENPGDELDPAVLEVFSETGSGNFLNQVGPDRIVRQNRRNVFVAVVTSAAPLLRFRFQLDAISVRDRGGNEQSLSDHAWTSNDITFVGQERAEATVTRFVRNQVSPSWTGTRNPILDPQTFGGVVRDGPGGLTFPVRPTRPGRVNPNVR